jgi:hypothetical protein
MLVADYLRVAAKKAGVVAPPRTFGFHTFRRTQGMFLELLFRGRKAAEPDPVKSLEKTAPVFVEEVEAAKNVDSAIG